MECLCPECVSNPPAAAATDYMTSSCRSCIPVLCNLVSFCAQWLDQSIISVDCHRDLIQLPIHCFGQIQPCPPTRLRQDYDGAREVLCSSPQWTRSVPLCLGQYEVAPSFHQASTAPANSMLTNCQQTIVAGRVSCQHGGWI